MWITVNGSNSTEIDTSVFERILKLYPEEGLDKRVVFQEAMASNSIDLKTLVSESDKILIPWQLFLLTPRNFNSQLKHIEEQRQHKVSPKLMVKRKGAGDVTSKRIIDRLIRQQNFLTNTAALPVNRFCSSLKGMTVKRAAAHILSTFDIDYDVLWKRKGKEQALDYLIRQVEAQNVNVSRGVLTNKILPTWQVVPSEVYRNTSGFAIKDERIPFVFLPSEINPDEVESRQIYTLIYLIVIIGLDLYDHYLGKDFKAKMAKKKGAAAKIHGIATEVLMPSAALEEAIKGKEMSMALRDELADKFKVSLSALTITLLKRGHISKKEFDTLKPPEFIPKRKKENIRSPRVSTSVRKFCGAKCFQVLNAAIRNRTLQSVQAQYLIFGAVNKKGYYRYRAELGL